MVLPPADFEAVPWERDDYLYRQKLNCIKLATLAIS